ncbi:MAG: hypothetical protein K6G50_11470 [bacterium]|nr:hypothetical protein [bacterium]
MSIIGDLTSKISDVVSRAVDKVTASNSGNTNSGSGATVNTTDRATVTKGYSAGSTQVASLDDDNSAGGGSGSSGSSESSGTLGSLGANAGSLLSSIVEREPAGSRSSESAHETTAADADVSDDVKELAGRMMDSEYVEDPHREDSNGNPTMTLEDITVLAASSGNDEIHVSNWGFGGIKVTVNGEEYTYTSSEARTLIIDAGSGNDNVTVDEDVKMALNITGGAGNDNIVGGAGNDVIIDNYDSNVIDGGAGEDILVANGKSSRSFFDRVNDYINGDETALVTPKNIIAGGAGNDYIEGGFGNDIIDGGEGGDIIYGLDGNDTIAGGDGDDYIDGGEGKDVIDGGEGNDKLFGGKGDDTIAGGAGNDVIAGGKGNDIVDGGEGADSITVYKQPFLFGKKDYEANKDVVAADAEDTISEVQYMEDIPKNISVEGDAAFRARVESDLETLASIAPGQAALKALSGDGHDLVIKETYGGDVNHSYTSGNLVYDKNNKAHRGKGADSWIGYNTADHNMYGGDNTWDEVAPIVSLVHEMGHSYNYATGTADPAVYDSVTHEHIYNADGTYSTDTNRGEAGCEWQTVGGIGYEDIDDGVKRKENPKGFSENAMRNFLGYDLRDSYWSSPDVEHDVDTSNF